MAHDAPAGSIVAVHAAYPAALWHRDEQDRTPLDDVLKRFSNSRTCCYNIVRVLLRRTPERFVRSFFETPGELEALLGARTTAQAMGTAESLEGDDSLELCLDGLTALQVAVHLGIMTTFRWLLKQHAQHDVHLGPQDSTVRHGEPEHDNRRVVRMAQTSTNPDIKEWGKSYGRLFGRFDIDAGLKHVSDSCMVIFAKDVNRDSSLVALKFMRDEKAWRREQEHRTKFKLGSTGHIVQILDVWPDQS